MVLWTSGPLVGSFLIFVLLGHSLPCYQFIEALFSFIFMSNPRQVLTLSISFMAFICSILLPKCHEKSFQPQICTRLDFIKTPYLFWSLPPSWSLFTCAASWTSRNMSICELSLRCHLPAAVCHTGVDPGFFLTISRNTDFSLAEPLDLATRHSVYQKIQPCEIPLRWRHRSPHPSFD